MEREKKERQIAKVCVWTWVGYWTQSVCFIHFINSKKQSRRYHRDKKTRGKIVGTDEEIGSWRRWKWLPLNSTSFHPHYTSPRQSSQRELGLLVSKTAPHSRRTELRRHRLAKNEHRPKISRQPSDWVWLNLTIGQGFGTWSKGQAFRKPFVWSAWSPRRDDWRGALTNKPILVPERRVPLHSLEP